MTPQQSMNFVELLSITVDTSQSDVMPSMPVGPGDQCVGEANTTAKRLYILTQECARAAYALQGEARFGDDAQKCQDAASQWHVHEFKTKILYELFWVCVRDQYGLWDKLNVGIRKGWIVVWTQDDHMRSSQFTPHFPDGEQAKGNGRPPEQAGFYL